MNSELLIYLYYLDWRRLLIKIKCRCCWKMPEWSTKWKKGTIKNSFFPSFPLQTTTSFEKISKPLIKYYFQLSKIALFFLDFGPLCGMHCSATIKNLQQTSRDMMEWETICVQLAWDEN